VAGSSRQLDWILGGGALGVVVLSSLVWRDSLEPMESLKWLFGGLLLIGSVVVVLLVAWHLWSRPTTPTARELALRFEAVRSMSGAQFEVFTADLFRALGYQAVVLGGAGDQGVDVIVNRGRERVAVQCKNHNRPVGNRPVQEVFAGAWHHRCVEACVVAPGGYTIGAKALARSTGVSLFDADTVRQLIRKVDKIEKERASELEIRDQNTLISNEIAETRKRAVWYPHPDDPPKN
jgi:restriction system protein